MAESKEERKSKLRDWMTATCQLSKAQDNRLTSSDLSYLFRETWGIKMKDRWVDKALYGARQRSNPPEIDGRKEI